MSIFNKIKESINTLSEVSTMDKNETNIVICKYCGKPLTDIDSIKRSCGKNCFIKNRIINKNKSLIDINGNRIPRTPYKKNQIIYTLDHLNKKVIPIKIISFEYNEQEKQYIYTCLKKEESIVNINQYEALDDEEDAKEALKLYEEI